MDKGDVLIPKEDNQATLIVMEKHDIIVLGEYVTVLVLAALDSPYSIFNIIPYRSAKRMYKLK